MVIWAGLHGPAHMHAYRLGRAPIPEQELGAGLAARPQRSSKGLETLWIRYLLAFFGGQDDPDDDRRRGRAQDFISRYEQGSPYDGISGDEAYHNYQAVAGRLSPQELEQSATEAFERMSPQERMEFARLIQQRQGGEIDHAHAEDPRRLARVTSQVHQQQPEGLGALFGGGGTGELLGGPLGGSQRGGRNDGGTGDMLNNPIAKAALGGIAAMAMEKTMGGR